MIHNLGLIAAAVIVVVLGLIVRKVLTTFKELAGGMPAELNAMHWRFYRELENRARAEANGTDEAFPTVVLDELAKHFEAVNQLKDAQAAKARKAAK